MRVGLDWGTTNTSATIYDGRRVRLLDLDPVNANPSVLRTALFIGREGDVALGRAAINRYTEGNVGREIEYQRTYIGEIAMTFAGVGTIRQGIFVDTDANAPGRLFLSIKLALSDPTYTSTNVFGATWSVEELIALTLKRIGERVHELTGEQIDEIVIGRPVHYATEERRDQIAIKRMRAAAELAGLRNVQFLAEPTAAALTYRRQSHRAQHVLVFDFGGGTLDVTIMRIEPNGQREILATDGVPVGGDLLDQRIVMGKLHPHFGAGAVLGPRRLPLPAFLLDHLEGWQSIVEMHNPKTLDIIDEAIRTGDKPQQLRALRALVRENYGLPLYEMVEGTKRQLSETTETTLSMHASAINFDESLARWDFERLIGPDVRAVDACLKRALSAAQLDPREIDVVLRTGGSSRVPRFVRLLEETFGNDSLFDEGEGIFTSVASGLGAVFSDPHLRRQLADTGHLQ
ncbi:MAG TPA: Hsp70 family protein [Herpetosiphonaceae bacterium]